MSNDQRSPTTIEKSITDAAEFAEAKALLEKSTMPPIGASMRGFPTEAEATELGQVVLMYLKMMGSFLNLERFDAVTIAHDYDAALAEVDRGIGQQQPITATRDEFAFGIAMAVTVLRDDVPKSHLVVNAGILKPLIDGNDPYHQLAVGIIAHEAAHVHDLLMQDRAFPGVILRKRVSYLEHALFDMATCCWSEYAATRLSAGWADEKTSEQYECTFCNFIAGVRERVNERIKQYRTHHDLHRLVPEVVGQYGDLLKYAGYLLGHVAGLGVAFAEACPKANDAVNAKPYFIPIFQRLTQCFEMMWSSYGKWAGMEALEPLKKICHDLLKVGGVDIQERAEGAAFIDVPFTPDTLPALPINLSNIFGKL